MCFSATASFAAAGTTAIGGIVALASARRTSHRLLAVIPLSFALHQGAEGVIWLALTVERYAHWLRPAVFTFLLLGRVAWPIVVPLAFFAQEPQAERKRWLATLAAIGPLVSVALAIGLVAYPVSANAEGAHVQYRLDSPLPFRWVTDTAYAIVTVLPPLISTSRQSQVLGLLVLASLILSKLVFYEYAISVWCFFAAWCSLLIVLIVRSDRAPAAS